MDNKKADSISDKIAIIKLGNNKLLLLTNQKIYLIQDPK